MDPINQFIKSYFDEQHLQHLERMKQIDEEAKQIDESLKIVQAFNKFMDESNAVMEAEVIVEKVYEND